MSKIEEMAEGFATEGDEFSGLQVIEIEKDAYIAGANAVLREIEKALDAALETCSIIDGYVKAREIIKELKGE